MQIINQIKQKTKRFQHNQTLKTLKSNKRSFIKIQKYNLPNNTSEEIYVFKKEEELTLGQSIWGTIVLNNTVNSFPENAKNYILLHEQGHLRLNPIISILLVIGIVSSAIIALSGILGVIGLLLFSLIKQPIINPIYGVISIAILTLPYCILQFLNEGNADYQAIKTLGVKKFKAAKKEIKAETKHLKNKLPKWKLILYNTYIKLTYPPENWIIKIYETLNKGKE